MNDKDYNNFWIIKRLNRKAFAYYGTEKEAENKRKEEEMIYGTTKKRIATKSKHDYKLIKNCSNIF